jgi:flagellar basal-body rod modification protein FlgD
MSITAIGSADTTTTSSSQLSMEDFLQVLLTQLTYQDPLKPVDNQEFMGQLAQFTTLEQTRQLNDGIQALLNNQSTLQSVGLIGRTVDITTSNGPVTGTVSALSLAGTSPLLTLNTSNGAVSNIDLSQITSVR